RAALKLAARRERPCTRGPGLQGLALAQIRLGRWDDAGVHLYSAANIWTKRRHPYDVANHRFTQGYLEGWAGNRDIALELLDESVMLCDDIPSMASRDALRKQILDTRQQIVDGTLEDFYRIT